MRLSGAPKQGRSARKVRKGGRLRSLVVAPLALAMLAVPALTSSTSASAATANSSGLVVTNVREADGTMMYDASTHLAVILDFTLANVCDPAGTGEIPLNVHYVSTPSGGILNSVISGTNVPVVLYKTNSPVTDIAKIADACASGAFISPPVGNGTVSAAVTQWATDGGLGNSGTWQISMTGTYVDAATGKTCQLQAHMSQPWSFNPFSFDDVGSINTFGC